MSSNTYFVYTTTNFRLLAVVVLFLVLIQPARAEVDSAVVDTYVGLESPFRVICTSVNFGVWFVPVGNRGGDSTIELTIASDSTNTLVAPVGSGSDRLALINSGNFDSPLAGVCNVRGSLASDSTALIIEFDENTNVDISLIPGRHIFAQDLFAAPQGANLLVNLTAPEAGRTTVVTTGGEAVFRVTGTLKIPNNLTVANYGAYRGASSATIFVEDNE